MSVVANTTLKSETDLNLAQRVALFLARQHIAEFRQLSIEAAMGQVSLSGMVSSFYHRQLAVAATRHVSGVQSVVDKISVTPVRDRSRPSLAVGPAWTSPGLALST